MNKGFFVSFEGPDGSGKTTQINLFKEYLISKNYDIVFTREPGGTAISEKIRQILLDPENKEMDGLTEAFLYASSRAQHVAQLIKPSLEAGKIVISDRFMDSSIAYQGFGRSLGDDVRIINEIAVAGTQPDITFFLDIDPEKGMKRVRQGRALDRLELEKLDFHKAVYEGYMHLKNIYPSRFVVIDADRPIEDISAEIIAIFEKYVAEKSE